MVSRTFICLVFISLMSECFSQEYIYLETYNIDSLLLVLPDQHAEDRINTLNRLSISLCYEEFEKSKQYALKAMTLAKELDYQQGIADSYRNFGHIAFFQSNFPDALNNYLESLPLYEKQNKKHTVARVYFDIAKTHLSAGNYEKLFEYGNIALDKFREPLEGGATVGIVRDTITLIMGIAVAYKDLGMFDKALETYLKVLEVGKKNNFGNTEMMLTTLLVANCYFWIGENDSAIVYWDKALAYPENNPSLKAMKHHTLTSQADLYYSEGKIDSAIFYYQKAFEWYSEYGILFWAMYYANVLASFHYEINEFVLAEKYFQQSDRLFEEMRNKNSWYRYDSLKNVVSYGTELYWPMPQTQMKEMMWWQGRKMYYGLYQINEANKRTENSLKYFIEYYNATDTLNNIMRNRETIELQTKYESERKDRQIETLSLENELKESRLKQNSYFLFGSAGLFFIILMFGYILFRQNRLKTNQQMILLQQKLFRSQMNPHFIFNSLTCIQGFITEKDTRTASRYLSKFAKLIRNILDSSIEEFIPLAEEIATIENYLELQKLRYEGKFDYSIEVDEKIDTETITIPPMLAQPFIENSIEHGFKHKNARGNLKIRFSLKNNLIVFEIEDDGIGREKAQEIGYKLNKDHRSMATDITRERLMVLNKKLKQKIKLNIVDLKNEKNEPAGTKVTFDIPYRYV